MIAQQSSQLFINEIRGAFNLKQVHFNDYQQYIEDKIETIADKYLLRYNRSRSWYVPKSLEAKFSVKYLCKLGGRSRKSQPNRKTFKTNCNSAIVIQCERSGDIITLSLLESECQFIHNHSVDPVELQRIINIIPKDKIKKAQELRSFHVPTGIIRVQLGLEYVSPQRFYDLFRYSNTRSDDSEVTNIKASLDEFQNQFSSNLMTNGKTVYAINMYNNLIKGAAFVLHCIYLDDTRNTNKWGMPLIAANSKDANGFVQLAGFGLMNSATQEDFELFLIGIQKCHGMVKNFVVDHNFAQIAAIRKIFPDAKLLYCLLHIKRNLIHAFKSDSEIVQNFLKLYDYRDGYNGKDWIPRLWLGCL